MGSSTSRRAHSNKSKNKNKMKPTSRIPIRRNIQLCYPFSEKRLLNKGNLRSKWSPPYIYQDKLNGERCRAEVDDSQSVLLFSSTNELITTLPHLNQQLSTFEPGEYDGELYVHGWTWAKIHSVVSTTMREHELAPELDLWLFDKIEPEPLIVRITNLERAHYQASFKSNIHLVRTKLVKSLDEIMSLYDESIDLGYEGFVVKDTFSPYVKKDPAYRSPYWMKYKPKQQDIYPIWSMAEAISKDNQGLGMVGSFQCEDTEGNLFSVGAGKLTHSERTKIWNNDLPEGSLLVVEYQTLSDAKKVPHFSRAVSIIYPEDATLKNST